MGALARSQLEASSPERVILKDPQSTEREREIPPSNQPGHEGSDTLTSCPSPNSFWFPREEAQRCAQDLPQGQQPATAGWLGALPVPRSPARPGAAGQTFAWPLFVLQGPFPREQVKYLHPGGKKIKRKKLKPPPAGSPRNHFHGC